MVTLSQSNSVELNMILQALSQVIPDVKQLLVQNICHPRWPGVRTERVFVHQSAACCLMDEEHHPGIATEIKQSRTAKTHFKQTISCCVTNIR